MQGNDAFPEASLHRNNAIVTTPLARHRYLYRVPAATNESCGQRALHAQVGFPPPRILQHHVNISSSVRSTYHESCLSGKQSYLTNTALRHPAFVRRAESIGSVWLHSEPSIRSRLAPCLLILLPFLPGLKHSSSRPARTCSAHVAPGVMRFRGPVIHHDFLRSIMMVFLGNGCPPDMDHARMA